MTKTMERVSPNIKKCRATAIVKDFQIHLQGEHNHTPDERIYSRLLARKTARESVATSSQPTRQAFDDALREHPVAELVTEGILIPHLRRIEALEDNAMLAENSDSNDSDEGENAPELYQDESDEEIQLQPQQRAQNTRPTCVVCMDREPQVVLVPCGHQNLCAPCAYQWTEENGRCPTDRREIEIIVTTIPL